MKPLSPALHWCALAIAGGIMASFFAKLANPHIQLLPFALIANIVNALANVVFFYLFAPAEYKNLAPQLRQVLLAAWPLVVITGLVIFSNDINWFMMLKRGALSQAVPFHAVIVVVIGILIALICFKEKLTPRKIVGIILGLIGIGLLNA